MLLGEVPAEAGHYISAYYFDTSLGVLCDQGNVELWRCTYTRKISRPPSSLLTSKTLKIVQEQTLEGSNKNIYMYSSSTCILA